MISERHEFAGRAFLTVQETTVEQDFLFLELTREAGLDSLTIVAEETPEAFSERILGALVSKRAVLKILALFLVPPSLTKRRRFGRSEVAPRTWTPEVAEETAVFLGSLKSPEDKAKVRSLVLTLLIHFFESGIDSLWTTETSSVEAIPETEEGEISRLVTATDAGRPSS